MKRGNSYFFLIVSAVSIILLATIISCAHIKDPIDVSSHNVTYPIIDTNQTACYGNNGFIPCPEKGEAFYGQDAHYQGIQPAYKDNGDGTVTDLNTELMWQKKPKGRHTWYEAEGYAENLTLGGYSDWRIPSIKELISLVDANGTMWGNKPYIDGKYFDFVYGPSHLDGYRDIDVQIITSTSYIEKTLLRSDWWLNFGIKALKPGLEHNAPTFFGYNFSDGRIKGYPKENHPYLGIPTWLIRCVRGPKDYGINQIADNGDGTISDLATGLMWQKADDGVGKNWKDALSYAEGLVLAGHNDWRLPNQKELHSIVDYDYIPAVNPVFTIKDEKAWFWSSTSFERGSDAVYVAFGPATAYDGTDVHGAGAMRSDPKTGNPAHYSQGKGPQRDAIRILNYARCVRNIE